MGTRTGLGLKMSNISELSTIVAKRYSELLKELAKYNQVEGLKLPSLELTSSSPIQETEVTNTLTRDLD